MVLLRRVIGDALRSRRQGQHRTLREVSTAANVSLGYLSEIERGQKEASSELLASICDALGARLSEVLRDVSYTMAVAEQVDGVLTPGPRNNGVAPEALRSLDKLAPARPRTEVATDGGVSVTVRRDNPLRTTLRTTRNTRPGSGTARGREVVGV
jgi:transcriptional regulator with XRE-family HTH domain